AYTGKLLNGSTFETSSISTFPLSGSGTIKGWQLGLLKANAGTLNVPNTAGRILLIIPSALAYGTTGKDKAAPNSVIIFTIDLIGVSN
ncbi:MAG: FKBP-type peptidyl-prolyl cis-trans isomerase, partial [Ferruginibacter sp.]